MPDIGIVQTLDSTRKLQMDVQVVTLDDNLTHPYFFYIEMSKDNSSPVGTSRLFAPYDNNMLQYWSKYTGTVILSFNLDDIKNSTNSLSFLESHTDIKQHINNEQYNYSLIGRVYKVKQKGKEIIIYVEDIGWKFLQKVPSDFRNTYIANQSLDNAFQAICEFIDVDFAYSINDLSQYTFGADGYSIQKDGETIETVETILSKWDSSSEEDSNQDEKTDDPLANTMYENLSLIEFDNKNKNKDTFQDKEKTTNNKLVETDENQDKMDKYQEEFDQKILNLFIGNSYYEADISRALLDYGRITVTPQINTNSDNSNIGNSTITEENSDDNQSTDNRISTTDKHLGASNSSNKSSKSKKALTYYEVNHMTPEKAREESLKTDEYYHTTILRLRARAYLKHNISAYTNYQRFNY